MESRSDRKRRVKRSREEADDDELTLFSLSLFPLFSLFFCPSFPLSLCSSMSHHSFPLQLALSPSISRPSFDGHSSGYSILVVFSLFSSTSP